MEDLQQNVRLNEQTEETELQEKIKQRREARKRKILQNAKIRLEKLNLKKSGDGDAELHQTLSHHVSNDCEYSDPEVEPDVVQLPFQSIDNNYNINNSWNVNSTNEQKRPFAIEYKMHILLSVTVAYFVSSVLQNSIGSTFSIFMPLGLVMLTDKLFFPQQKKHNPVINILILTGMKSQEIVKFLNMMLSAQSIIADIAIYVFLFCLVSLLGNKYYYLVEIK